MTERQRRFADAYLASPNATRAAEAASDRILSINRARALLSDIAVSDNVAVNARLRAMDLLLRSAGAMMSPAAPKEQPLEDAEVQPEAQDNDGGGAIIMLPWNRDSATPVNAVQLSDGRVVPLAEHEGDDLLIYAILSQIEGTEDVEPDGEE